MNSVSGVEWRPFAIPGMKYSGFRDLPDDAQTFLRLRGASGNVDGVLPLPEVFGPIITDYMLGAVGSLRSYVVRRRTQTKNPVVAAMSLDYKDLDSGYVFLDSIAVVPEARGSGIGRTGLNLAARSALSHGANQVRLNAVRNPRTLEFYERYGLDLLDFGKKDYVHAIGDAGKIAKLTA